MSGSAALALRRWWVRRPEARFPLRFLVLTTAGVGLALALSPAWGWIAGGLARVVTAASNLAGLEAQAGPEGIVSFADGAFRYTIVSECTGLMLMLLYGAAVLAYPATRRQRAIGLAAGIGTLFLLNLARLVSLGWVGLHAPTRFETVHAFWWQGFLVLATGLGWLCWVRVMVHGTRQGARARALAGAAGIFAATFGGLAFAGVLGGVRAYATALRPLQWAAASLVWNYQIEGDLSAGAQFGAYVFDYAAAAGVVALFLAAPKMRWRRRVRGALLVGIPLIFFLQVAGFVLTFGVDSWRSRSALGSTGLGSVAESWEGLVLLVSRVALPVAAWYAWARRDWGRAFFGARGVSPRRPRTGARESQARSSKIRGAS